LMVTMLVRKACMSSLSSNQSSCQGVRFQLIDRRDNLGLEDEDGGTCAPDVSGPPGARSIRGWSPTTPSAPPGTVLMGSTSMIVGEVAPRRPQLRSRHLRSARGRTRPRVSHGKQSHHALHHSSWQGSGARIICKYFPHDLWLRRPCAGGRRWGNRHPLWPHHRPAWQNTSSRQRSHKKHKD
jgi:hypothetical protein